MTASKKDQIELTDESTVDTTDIYDAPVRLHFQVVSVGMVQGTSGPRKLISLKPVAGLDGTNMVLSDKADFGVINLELTNREMFDYYTPGRGFHIDFVPIVAADETLIETK